MLLEACATARDALTPKAPVGGGDTGPRSADTNIAPIKPMLINGNFVGADEIRKSCELKMGGSCEVFGIVFSNEKNIPKISPFVEHEGTNYVWGGPGKFDRLTQMPNEGKIQWADDNGFVYFVGIPEDGSITELKTLYYVDPDGKAWELQKPWGKLLASIVKPTPIPIETSTATPTAPATSTSTPTVAPTWTPAPTYTQARPLPTAVVGPTAIPKPENKPIVETDGVTRPGFVPPSANYLGNKLWSDQLLTTDCRKGKEDDPKFQLDPRFVYSFDAPTGSGYAPGLYYTCQYSDQKLVKITIWKVV